MNETLFNITGSDIVRMKDLAGVTRLFRKLERELLQGILKDRMESVRAQIRKHKQNLEKPRHIQQGLFGAEPEQLQIDFEKTFRKETEKKIEALEQTHAEYARLIESEDFGKLNERDYVLWEIDFAEVFISKGGFDIIIGNPPYVRQEEIGPPTIVERPTTREERKAYKEKLIRSVQTFLGRDVRIDKKSDLYIYFYYLGMSPLNKEGTFVFITSNSWLDVGYGAGLQEWLLRNMDVIDIYDNQAKRSFKSADVNTVICIFNKPEDDPLLHTARFTAFRKPFEEVLSSDTLLAIDEAEGILSTDDFRVYQATQEKLLEEGLETDKTRNGTDKVSALMGTYKGNKWGGKYLRAPDIYFKILEEAGDRLVRLGDVAQVRRGITTGCNEFFYLDDKKAAEWGIEEEFLVPVIKSPRECSTIIIDPNTLPNKLFMCHKTRDKLKNTQALAYIEWGESRGFHKRPSTRSRPRWWDVEERRKPGIIIPSSYGEIFKVFINQQVFVDKRLYECYTNDVPLIAAILNSTLTFFIAEICSRTGLGEGLLDLTVYEVNDWLILNPLGVSQQDKNAIVDCFQRLHAKTIKSVDQETKRQARRCVDEQIFRTISLDNSYVDDVYSGLSRMVANRLNRANTF